jgi:RNA polymerase sigma-70 factor (ECF subfamily)
MLQDLSIGLSQAAVTRAGRWSSIAPEAGERLSPAEELELLRDCQAGDWSGYGLLVQRYRRLVWSAVDAVLPDTSLAEDAVQAVFVRAYEKLGSFSFRSSFSSWLWRLARNYALNLRRRHNRRPLSFSLDGLLSQGRVPRASGPIPNTPAEADLLIDPAGDPAEALSAAARQGALRSMLADLPEDQRAALNLFYSAELSYEQIAQVLGMPVNTVRTKLHRAKARLAQLAVERGWRAG